MATALVAGGTSASRIERVRSIQERYGRLMYHNSIKVLVKRSA